LPLDRARGKAIKLDAKWLTGVFLGLKLGSNEMYLGTSTGVVRAAAVKRKTQNQRFEWAELNAVVGSPRKPTPGPDPQTAATARCRWLGIPLRPVEASRRCA
jgi:hypothetical protein